MKKGILNFLNQIIPVMIGVYLGFALNNFGEEQKLKRQTNAYKEMLKIELEENILAIDKVKPYHLDLSTNFREILKSSDIVDEFNSFKFMGLQPGFVNRGAFDTGIQTGIIQDFNLTVIQKLNKLYALQGVYTRYNENMINSFSTQKFPETEDEIKSMLRVMTMNMNDIHTFESDLLESYKDILKDLE